MKLDQSPAIWRGCDPGNFTRGRDGHRITAIVIHLMAGSLTGTSAWFCNAGAKVSAHYGVGRDGSLVQYVLETDTAFHAGKIVRPTWPLLLIGINPNLYTIGIEHEGRLADSWTDPMYTASSKLIADICSRLKIPLDREHIIGHHEIRANKACPGPNADLGRLIAEAKGLTSPKQS